MKTLNRKQEQTEIRDEQSEYVNKNIWRLTDADIRIKHWQDMIEHSQTQLKKSIEDKNDLLIKFGFV